MDQVIQSHFIIYAFISLFTILNPFGGAGMFYAYTETDADRERGRKARVVSFYAFMLLLGTAVFGNLIMHFFGITIAYVKIGGGLVVFYTAWKMLDGNRNDEAHLQNSDGNEFLFMPLTMPLTAGPGTIAVCLELSSKMIQMKHDWVSVISGYGAIIAAIALNALIIFLCYKYSGKLVKSIGTTGKVVVTKMSAFLVLCISVGMVWGGIEILIKSLN